MKIKLFVDYACPFCFLAEQYLKDLKPEFPNIEFDYQLCEAHPLPELRMVSKKDGRFWTEFMPNMAEENGTDISFPYNPMPYSSLAIQGMIALKKQGVDTAEYNYNMFDMVFRCEQNIEDIDVVLGAMKVYDVDLDLIKTQLEQKTFEQEQLNNNIVAYVENNIEVIPTFIYGDNRLEAVPGVGLTKQAIRDWLSSLN